MADPVTPPVVPISGSEPVVPQANAQVSVSPSTPSPSNPEWTSGFNEEMKGYIQNKGFKSPQDLADSYRNFERLQGVPQDRILKLPENLDTPEGRAIFERLGTPKDAKGYNFAEIQGIDEQAKGWLGETFAKIGVPKNMAETLLKELVGREAGVKAEQEKAQVEAAKAAEANLKIKWGNGFEANRNQVEDAVRTLGLSDQQVTSLRQALGPEGAPELLLKLAQATGEASFVAGGGGSQSNTPSQALSDIKSMKQDMGFMQAIAKGDMTAKAKWEQAHRVAYPGMVNT